MLPPVASFLAGSNVLVTGVTGFVGLALVEKLLRAVPEIGTIYVLIRPKRGKSMENRLNEIKDSSIFEVLINSGKQSALEKIAAFEGNIDEDNLGLSDRDQHTIMRHVNYVFHCAATLDFEASLKTTVDINLLGTRRVLELCNKIQDLKALLHVSSAYTNADKKSAEEILYPAPGDADKVVELVGTLTGPNLDQITPTVLKKHPNTYTFTKALAEHEVAKSFADIPSCIVRPSMIVGVWKDPLPGWTNSKNGPQGFMYGASMGVVRRLPVGKTLVYDYVPVDKVVNTMIVAAVYTASKRNKLTETPIFHCTSSTYNPFRWAMVEKNIPSLFKESPLVQAVWYPYLRLVPSVEWYRKSAFIFHMIPAYILDALTKLAGGRPRLVRLHTNINQSLERLEPFIFQEWMFDNSKQMELHKSLSPEDLEVFGLDLSALDWNLFFKDMTRGVRRYLHNEKDSSLPKAAKKHQLLKALNIVVQAAVFFLIFHLIKLMLKMPDLYAAVLLLFIFAFYSIM